MYKAGHEKKQKVDLGKKGHFEVRKGALHRALGIPEDEKIGKERMRAALHSDKPSVRKMARSGLGLSSMHH